jgi:hypothetical protein
MPVIFVTLATPGGKGVKINPALVRALLPINAGGTRILFDAAHAIDVEGELENVEQELTKGTNDG